MSKFLLVICTLLSGLFLYAQRPIDMLSYSYSIELNDRNDNIEGSATLKFIALRDNSSITIDLAKSNAQKKGMTVSRVWKVIGHDSIALIYSQEPQQLIIQSIIKKNDTLSFVIIYSGVPSDGLIISRNRFGKRTFFSDNWPNRAHNWIPCVDDPADKATVEFIVTAPSHYDVIANGSLVSVNKKGTDLKTTHWRESIALPMKIVVIGVADFAVKEEGLVGKIPVSTWVYVDNKEKGFYDYAPAKDVLAFFTDFIGPYPYEKLANVQSTTVFGGMENAGAIFYNENYVNGRRDQYALMAHEITHQWFGDMVTEKNFSHLWLSEGFASYLSIYYMEKQFGQDTAVSMRLEERDKVIAFARQATTAVVDSTTPYMQLLNANSYEKASWILHMLRHQLGDSIFRKIVQTFYDIYKGSNADTHDFQKVVEKLSAQSMTSFFQQWLYTPGIPKLDVNWSYSAADKKILVNVQQLQKKAFEFPLEIWIQTSSGNQEIKILEIKQAQQQFTFSATDKPLHIWLDPGVNLLFEGRISESK